MFLKRNIFPWSLYYFSFSHICDQVLLYTYKYILIYLWTDRVFICLFYLRGLGFLQPATQRSKFWKRRLPLVKCERLKISEVPSRVFIRQIRNKLIPCCDKMPFKPFNANLYLKVGKFYTITFPTGVSTIEDRREETLADRSAQRTWIFLSCFVWSSLQLSQPRKTLDMRTWWIRKIGA